MPTREPTPNTSAFPTALCVPCGKHVLTYVALDFEGEEARFCVHCDGPVAGGLKWISAGELEAHGYEIGYRPQKRSAGGGCDSGGCGSCSTKKH